MYPFKSYHRVALSRIFLGYLVNAEAVPVIEKAFNVFISLFHDSEQRWSVLSELVRGASHEMTRKLALDSLFNYRNNKDEETRTIIAILEISLIKDESPLVREKVLSYLDLLWDGNDRTFEVVKLITQDSSEVLRRKAFGLLARKTLMMKEPKLF